MLASLDKAVKYAYLAKDTLNAIRYYQNKQSVYANQNKLDSAIIINNQAAKLFNHYGYLVDSKIAFGCNFEYYLKKNRIKEAKKAFEAYQSTNYKGNANWEDSYAYFLSSNTITLPDNLEGEFELQITNGTVTYTGKLYL